MLFMSFLLSLSIISCCTHPGVNFSNTMWTSQLEPLYSFYQKDDTLLVRYEYLGKSTNWKVVVSDSLHYLNLEDGSLQYYRNVAQVNLVEYYKYESEALQIPLSRWEMVGEYFLRKVPDRLGFKYHNMMILQRRVNYRGGGYYMYLSFEDSGDRRYVVPVDHCQIWGILNAFPVHHNELVLFVSPQEPAKESGHMYGLVNMDSLLYLADKEISEYPTWPAGE